MYTGLVLDTSFLLCMLCMLVAGARGYEKTAWFSGLATSLLLFALPFYIAADKEEMLSFLGQYVQPRFAYDVLNFVLIIMFIAALVGIWICTYIGTRWWLRRHRAVA